MTGRGTGGKRAERYGREPVAEEGRGAGHNEAVDGGHKDVAVDH